MKSFNLMLIYVLSFMTLFFILSMIGLLWESSYTQIISNGVWFGVYALLIGSWTAIFPTREYYVSHQQYFDRVFG